MKIRVLLVISLLLWYSTHLSAQYNIQGKVTNKVTKEALPFANVQVKKQGKTVAFGATSDDGTFSIATIASDSLTIKTSYIGFATSEFWIVIPADEKNPFIVNIALSPTSNLLQNVIVEGEKPSGIVKQDTIIYNIEKHVDGSEASLGELLDKLPGIEVGENSIKVNGEKVDKLLLNGEEFFINQHGLATKNIGANIVGGVEFYDNYEDPSDFKGFDTKNTKALNIGVKEEYQNKITGNISAAGGVKDKYHGRANLFRFGKKSNLGLIGDLNNTGEKTLSIMDYLNTADPALFSGSGATSLEMSDGLSDLIFAKDDVAFRESKLGTINLSLTPSRGMKLYFYTILSNSIQATNSFSTRNLLSASENIINTNQEKSTNNITLNNSYLNISYKINENTQLKYTANTTPITGDFKTHNINSFINTSQLFGTTGENSPLSFNQQLELGLKLSKKTLLTAQVLYNSTKIDNKKIIYSNSLFLNLPFSTSSYRVQQLSNKSSNTADAHISMLHKSRKNRFIELKIGKNRNTHAFKSNLLEVLNNDLRPIAGDGFRNDTTINNDALYIGTSIYKNSGFLQYKIGGTANALQIGISDAFGDKTRTVRLLPNVEFTFQFKSTNKLTLAYKKENTLVEASDIASDTTVVDFQQLGTGRVRYDNISDRHTISVKHRFFDLFSNTVMMLYSSLIFEDNVISTNTTSETNYSISEQRIAPKSNTFRSSIFLDKTFNNTPIKLRLVTNYNVRHIYRFVDNQLVRSTSSNISLKPKITTLFKSGFNLESGIELVNTINRIDQGLQSNSFRQLNTFIKLKQKYENGILLRLNLKYDQYNTNTDLKQKLYLIDGMIRYKKKSGKVEYIARANNILNLTSNQKIQTSSTASFFAERTYSSLPGYVLFEIKFTL